MAAVDLVRKGSVITMTRESDDGNTPYPADWLYRRGRPCGHATLVLEGAVWVISGGVRSEVGPMAMLAPGALLAPDGAFAPDFGCFLASASVRLLQLTTDVALDGADDALAALPSSIRQSTASPASPAPRGFGSRRRSSVLGRGGRGGARITTVMRPSEAALQLKMSIREANSGL